ncbi:hypothetical protein [Actinomadura oligospora]|uniref:hypothetical protein n=1 Tax=Actinomadura oligospora TaxID=111804 RepID=UPI0004796F50|nr:hypothetical protein [Actinomadura oligospora]
MGRPTQPGGAGSGRPPTTSDRRPPPEEEPWPPGEGAWPPEQREGHPSDPRSLPPEARNEPPEEQTWAPEERTWASEEQSWPPQESAWPSEERTWPSQEPGRLSEERGWSFGEFDEEYAAPGRSGALGDVPPGHGGGGLTRGEEQFRRVYSAPESPKAERRPRLLMVLVAVVSFAVAAGVVFLLAPSGGGGGEPKAGPTETSPRAPAGTGGQPSSAPPKASTPPKSPSRTAQPTAKPFTALALPDACGTVSGAVLNRVAPGASKQANSNNTLATCTFTSKAPFRWLLVEMYLYPTGNLPDAVGDARRNYDARWTQAHSAPLARTFALEQVSGLGDEAFRSFKEDKGQPLVVGEVTARRGNVVIRVGYSRQLPSGTKPESVQQSALTNATDAAREVLDALR